MNNDTPHAGRREWIGLAVIALPCLLYAMDLTVLNLALPAISKDLKPTATQLLWIMDIYGFLVAGALIPMGTLGDRIGRRKLLMYGATAFAIASVVAACSRSAGMLIATRAVLGLAGATLAPSTLSLIRNMFLDPKERTFAIGVWITSYSVGGAIGPLVGGVLLAHFWWGSVFLPSIPVMALLLVLGPMLLPEYRDPDAQRLDLLSAIYSLVSVVTVIYGIKELAGHGVKGGPPFFAILLGIITSFIFIRRQKTVANPLIDLNLFKSRAFSASLAVYMLGTFVAFGLFIFTSQYLQLVLELSPMRAGLWILPSFVGFMMGSMLCPILVRRIEPAYVMAIGLLLAAVGFALLSQLGQTPQLILFLSGLGLYSFGLAPVFTLTTDLIVSTALPEKAGAASAISETSSELGGALGIAILGSIGSALYRRSMAHFSLDGHALSAPVIHAARETLGGATAAADSLPPDSRLILLSHAREAFLRGLHGTVFINIFLTIFLALVTIIYLRRGEDK